MPSGAERGRPASHYGFRFALAALLLVSITLVLVLFVLPERYVLSSGFRESGLSFPEPRIPFVPLDPVRVAAQPGATLTSVSTGGAGPEVEPEPGPAELFWTMILPLLEAGRYEEALPRFGRYLAERPTDDAVRAELARTLIAAGRPAEAVPVLSALVSDGDAPLRALLARTLRDVGRMDEASPHYAFLLEASPADEGLVLEWARALSWLERYVEAERVLVTGLERMPEAIPLRLELARIHYYTDRLVDAERILAAIDPEALRAAGALTLLADVRAALAVPAVEPLSPPTLLERSLAAREADDHETARMLLERALLEDPTDPELWLAYANLLEYELADFDGARPALLEVERLSEAEPAIQLRLARLEAWAGRDAQALSRLADLLTALESRPQPSAAEAEQGFVSVAEVHALMGDLLRFDGDRLAAARSYELALHAEPTNVRAADGLVVLRAETARVIDEVERPRMGGEAYGAADTDDFERLDLGAAWTEVHDSWVWSGTAGSRWIAGRDPAAGTASAQGLYVALDPARWWRWGTVRTALHVGAQGVGPGAPHISIGAALRYRASSGTTLDASYRHEPGYALATTLQSVYAELALDRLSASFEHPLDARWSIALQSDAALLDPGALSDAAGSVRLQAALAVGRALSERWTLGWDAAASTWTDPSPVVGGLRLFWDPAAVLATGPFARLRAGFAEPWRASLRVGAGLALVDERETGFETVPQVTGDARLEYAGEGLRSALELFYGQTRLEGYRTYGMRVSIGTPGLLGGPG